MNRRTIFTLLGTLLLLGSVARAAEPRKDALFVSYDTPETDRGLDGRFELVRKLDARGFRLTIVSDRFPERADAIKPTPENLVAALDRLAADPEVRELAIILDLHGIPRKKHERSHSVLFGKTELSLDRFRPALRRLRARRARVVMLDLSCYSGASLRLARDGACIATDGSHASENYAQFLDTYAAELRPEASFEEAFLAARRVHFVPRTPRISSDAGRAAIAEEEVIERAFGEGELARVLAYEKKIGRLSWTTEERAKVAEGFQNWRDLGSIGPSPPLFYLPPSLQSAMRFLPLVEAERTFYERNIRAYRADPPEEDDERAASRACVDFKF